MSDETSGERDAIQSLLDQDLYKFSMMQSVLHNFSASTVEYDFKLRNYPNGTLDRMKGPIEEQIRSLCELRFQKDELEYLGKLPWFKPDFIEYLRIFQLNPDYVRVYVDDTGEFRITIMGPWVSTILFEVPILAIVSEVFSWDEKRCRMQDRMSEGDRRLKDKIKVIRDYNSHLYASQAIPTKGWIKIVDFGTRRRYSRWWHNHVLGELVKELPSNIVGTSNVGLAKAYDIKPIGTMAHEYIQAMQGMKNVRLSESQRYAFDSWAREYRGQLGIALSDCLGMDAFFRDFDLYFAKLFDGARHDSGDPCVWADKLISHYNSMGIDPMTKSAVFSDNLNFEKAVELHKVYKDQINVSFGIGTSITNDMGLKAPQIVIKMTKCNGFPVAKISDSKGKMMCRDKEFLKYLAYVFKIPIVWEE